MVTTRTPKEYQTVRDLYLGMLLRFGKTYTYTTETTTIDPMGNVTAISTSSSTILGDFQVIEDEFKIQQLGFAGMGVAKFYGRASDSLDTGGQITVDANNIWVLRKRVEDDEWTGEEIASVWYVVRLSG